MSTRIDYDTHSVFGRKIAEMMQTLVQAKNQVANLKASFDAMADGTTPTFNQIEAEVGGMMPGTGEPLYNIIVAMNQKLSSATFDDTWKLYRG